MRAKVYIICTRLDTVKDIIEVHADKEIAITGVEVLKAANPDQNFWYEEAPYFPKPTRIEEVGPAQFVRSEMFKMGRGRD